MAVIIVEQLVYDVVVAVILQILQTMYDTLVEQLVYDDDSASLSIGGQWQ